MEVPTTVGVFGGYPGGTAWYECAIGAHWRERFAAGQSVGSIEEAGGKRILPQAKSTITLGATDAINHVTQNGGGYGDPLERVPAQVLRDVARGSVTPASARSLYGVVVDGGTVDQSATERLRAKLLQQRIDSLPESGYDHSPRELLVVRKWSDILNLVRDGEDILVQSTHSGAILGPLGDDWRATAPYRVVEPAELGPLIRLHDDLELRQYLDPLTGRSLLVDFVRVGDSPMVDFKLSDLEYAGREDEAERDRGGGSRGA